MDKVKKTEIINEYKRHDGDTGSSAVIVVVC